MSKNYCKSCKKAVEQTAKFCPECGSRLETITIDKPKSSPDKSQKGKTLRFQQLIYSVGALAFFTLGYFVVVEPEPVPVANQPQQMPGHGEGGMDMDIPDLPEDYGGLITTGDKYMDEGNFPLAAECYKRALDIDSSSANVRSDFGSCLYGMGLADRALEEFRKVLAIDPSHGIALFNLGIVFYGQGAKDSAKYYMGEYLKLEPLGKPSDRARELISEMGM